MSAIKVFSVDEALDAIRAAPLDASNPVLTLKAKKDAEGKLKKYVGAFFLTAQYQVGKHKNDGWFTITSDIPVRHIADPADKSDKRTEFDRMRLQLEIKISQAGTTGLFFDALDAVWKAKVGEMVEKKEIVMGSRKIHEVVQHTLSSESHPDKSEKELLMDDPILRFQIDFRPFPTTYPHAFLRNTAKTIILDGSKPYIDAKGVTQYKPATVIENNIEVPVTAENIHKFVKRGSVLKAGSRVMAPSGAVSASWISLPITVNKMIIEPGNEIGGFSDEVVPDNEAYERSITGVKPSVPIGGAHTTPQPVEEKTPSLDNIQDVEEAIEDAIENMSFE